jgi:hypothetical protein
LVGKLEHYKKGYNVRAFILIIVNTAANPFWKGADWILDSAGHLGTKRRVRTTMNKTLEGLQRWNQKRLT